MSDQFEAINTAIRIISNLLRKTDDMETTIECLRGVIRDRDKLVDELNEQMKQKNETIDNLTEEIEIMKKKEDKK